MHAVDANHNGNGMRGSAGEIADLRPKNEETESALRSYLLRLRTGSRSADDTDDDAVCDSVVVEAGAEVDGFALRGNEGKGSNEVRLEAARQPARVGVMIINKWRNPDGEDDFIRSGL